MSIEYMTYEAWIAEVKKFIQAYEEGIISAEECFMNIVALTGR